MMKRRLMVLGLVLALVLALSACSTGSADKKEAQASVGEKVGTLVLKVNPEIKINYDENGKVTSLEGENKEAKEILKGYDNYKNKDASVVVRDLVEKIGDAGYFVEEVEGERREIILEIEKGSKVPGDGFMDKIVKAVEEYINSKDWTSDSDYDDDDKKPQIVYTDQNGNTNKVYDDSDYGQDDDSDYDQSSNNRATVPVNNTDDDSDYDSYHANDDDTDYDDDSDYASQSAPAPTRPARQDNSDYDDSGYDDSDYDD